MMTDMITQILAVIAQSSHNGSPVWLLLAGPLGGGGTYWVIYRYYRNADKSFDFERETIVNAQPVQGGEQKVDHISKTRNSTIEHGNADKYRERVQRVQ